MGSACVRQHKRLLTQCEATALAARDAPDALVTDARVARVREVQLPQRLVDGVPALRARRARYPQAGRQHERLLHGEVAVEVVILPDKGRGVVRRLAGQAPAQDLARALRQHPAEHVQQRRLARARGPHDGEESPLERSPADILQDGLPVHRQRDRRPRERRPAAQAEHRGVRIAPRRGQPRTARRAGEQEERDARDARGRCTGNTWDPALGADSRHRHGGGAAKDSRRPPAPGEEDG